MARKKLWRIFSNPHRDGLHSAGTAKKLWQVVVELHVEAETPEEADAKAETVMLTGALAPEKRPGERGYHPFVVNFILRAAVDGTRKALSQDD